MEEPGELCAVVFVLIVMEPASERVCVGEGRRVVIPSATWFWNNLCKDDSALFSRFLHGHTGLHPLAGEEDLQYLWIRVRSEPELLGWSNPEPENVLGSGSGLFQIKKKLPGSVNFLLKYSLNRRSWHIYNFLNLFKNPLFLLPEIFFFRSSFCLLSQVWRIGSGKSRIRKKTFQIHTLVVKRASSVKSLLPTKQITWLVLFLIYLLCL